MFICLIMCTFWLIDLLFCASILIAYFVVNIFKNSFNWFWLYTVDWGIRRRNIFLRGKKDFWSNLNISKQLFASGTMIYKSQNKRGKSETRSLEALKIRKTCQQKKGRQERYRRYQRYEERNRRRKGKKEKSRSSKILGYIGRDKMARVDEDINNRLFRREIRILTLLL